MTEKKPPSTVQPEQIQGFNSPAEDELNLIDFLKLLAKKKVFILAVTSVCTLFSIFYTQSLTPLYRATVGLLDPKEGPSSFSTLEQIDPELADKAYKETINQRTIFKRFLFNIKSYELKKKVFVNGGFQKKFFHETKIDKDQSVLEIYNSIKKIVEKNNPYLVMKGYRPEVMLEFLTALIKAAEENVNAEINDITHSIVKTRINNLSTQIEQLQQKIALQKEIEKEKRALQKEIEIGKRELQKQIKKEQKVIEKEKRALQKEIKKEQKAIEIVRLSKALIKAKQMGIKNNNFDKPDKKNSPLWFQYGELALQQKIDWLKSELKSEEEIPNNKNLSIEKLKLKKIQQETMRLRSKLKKFQQETNRLRSKLKNFPQETKRLRSKQDSSETKELKIKKAKLKRLQTAVPLLKLKVVTIGKNSYSLVKPYQRLITIGFGVAFGLFISILMAFLIELKQSGAKENPFTAT